MKYPDQNITTANEIHLPVGVPVDIKLESGDVIHSFWAPELDGKMDVVPAEINHLILQADEVGVYHGQCAEYCGLQHVHMGFLIFARSQEDFNNWLTAYQQPATTPTDPLALRGQQVFMSAGCVYCHPVDGLDDKAIDRSIVDLGPDLTHVYSRRMIAAATLLNNRGNLAGWIVGAQHVKPGSLMPNMPVGSEDLQALLAYLGTSLSERETVAKRATTGKTVKRATPRKAQTSETETSNLPPKESTAKRAATKREPASEAETGDLRPEKRTARRATRRKAQARETQASDLPPGESTERLFSVWSSRPGIAGWLSAVNHKAIGARYIVTGFLFLALAGAAALAMRTQLAVPENNFLNANQYSQLFTTHGVTMMFLFAVPIMLGVGIYFVPLMIGARDVPFPRANAFLLARCGGRYPCLGLWPWP